MRQRQQLLLLLFLLLQCSHGKLTKTNWRDDGTKNQLFNVKFSSIRRKISDYWVAK